jgi:hypothetical protein
MRSEDIKAARDKTPFVPFRVVFTDGRAVKIPHPDYMFVNPHTIDITVAMNPNTGIPTESISASPLHIVRLEYLKPLSDEG